MICPNPAGSRSIFHRGVRSICAAHLLLFALGLFCPAAARAATVEVDAGVTGGSCCVYKTIDSVPGQGTNNTTISVGDTVHWVWKTNFHSVSSDTGAWTDSGVHNSGFTFDVTFNTPGTFGYYCSIHGSPGARMFGTVTVTAAFPLPPANLTATAGDSQVALGWNASTNATGYNVKRGTATGGPYTALAQNVTATTYTDKTAQNGVPYFYVVSAVNSAGESSNSSEASATPVGQTVTGRIAIDGVSDLATVSSAAPLGLFTLDFRTPGSTIPLVTRQVSLAPVGGGSPFGTFSAANVAAGTYDIAIKGAKTLRLLLQNKTVSGATALPDMTLTGGDADNNNAVDIGDFGALVNAYNGDSALPGSGYDASADFNYDGKIDIADFGILVNNYNKNGAP